MTTGVAATADTARRHSQTVQRKHFGDYSAGKGNNQNCAALYRRREGDKETRRHETGRYVPVSPARVSLPRVSRSRVSHMYASFPVTTLPCLTCHHSHVKIKCLALRVILHL